MIPANLVSRIARPARSGLTDTSDTQLATPLSASCLIAIHP